MSGPAKKEEALAALAHEFNEREPDEKTPWQKYQDGWRFALNPVQEEARASDAIYILMDGERGSGKSIGGLALMVEYCFLNPNAFGVLIVREVAMGTDGGAWHKLNTIVLPAWRDGNRDREGTALDAGVGMQFTEPRYDAQTKKPYVWIESRLAGVSSMIMLISLPVETQVEGKIKGREPSFIMIDEAQTLQSEAYFTDILQQLGRRPGMKMKQKIIYCANPEGPSHWLYQLFFVRPVNAETGEWDPRFARFHVPISENLSRLPPRYYEDYVIPAVRGDAIKEARMVRGEWVDRPTGHALFRDSFKPELHTRGDALRDEGIYPVKGHPVILSYDLGAAHTCIHFEQVIPTKDKIYKIIFDEMDFVGTYMPYSRLVPMVIERMMYWESVHGGLIQWAHISDDSAFNQYRSKDGSFDAWDIEEISRDYVEKKRLSDRFKIRLKPAPKGKKSREARLRMMFDAFHEDAILISATCRKTIYMIQNIEQDHEDPMACRKDGKLDHVFDALTYGLFSYWVGKGRFNVSTAKIIAPMSYRIANM